MVELKISSEKSDIFIIISDSQIIKYLFEIFFEFVRSVIAISLSATAYSIKSAEFWKTRLRSSNAISKNFFLIFAFADQRRIICMGDKILLKNKYSLNFNLRESQGLIL